VSQILWKAVYFLPKKQVFTLKQQFCRKLKIICYNLSLFILIKLRTLNTIVDTTSCFNSDPFLSLTIWNQLSNSTTRLEFSYLMLQIVNKRLKLWPALSWWSWWV